MIINVVFGVLSPGGSMWMENKRGPRMDPCGTPQWIGAGGEVNDPIFTEKVLPFKYEANHTKARPWTPTAHWSRFRNILWSTVSNAALRSKSIRIADDPESMESRMSFVTFSNADSVLYSALKPDWNGSKMLNVSRYKVNCESATFSKTFEMNESYER